MKLYIAFTIILVCVLGFSCHTSFRETFPYSEKEMLENGNCGTLLEYAIFDSTKIEFVKSIICDSLRQNRDLCFSKFQLEIKDTSYYQFIGPYEEDWNVINDYYGIIYFDINKVDSFFIYNADLKYGINDFDLIIEKIAARYNKTPLEIITNRKVGNTFTPSVYFIVQTESMRCEAGFVEDVIKINRFINDLMNLYSKRKFPKEELKLSPYIKIRKNIS